MSNSADGKLEFRCPKCDKRLRAGVRAAGKKVACPKCGQTVKVPGSAVGSNAPGNSMPPQNSTPATSGTQSVPAPAKDDLDWLSLETPAIDDLADRQSSAAEIKTQKAANKPKRSQPASAQERADRKTAAQVTAAGPAKSRPENSDAASGNSSIPFGDDDDELQLEAERSDSGSTTAPKSTAAKPSIFDDDLPELSELEPVAKRKQGIGEILNSQGLENLSEIDLQSLGEDDFESAMKPSKGGAARGSGSSKAGGAAPIMGHLLDDQDYAPEVLDDEYRITCKVCDTPQYVKQSAAGMKIKCPDCFSLFKAPPPPKGWKPKKRKKNAAAGSEGFGFAEDPVVSESQESSKRKSRTSAMLEKAEQEIGDEEIDDLYGGDFDTAGFVQRTFGLFKDPVTIAFICGYGIVFACVFALAQFGFNNSGEGYGRGAMLFGLITAPLIAIVFALPMISAALALLESVANQQRRVEDWPGFDMFDNFGELLTVVLSLAASFVPGFLIGGMMGLGEFGMSIFAVAGGMISLFLLFPVILLSIMDNGSLFQPVSGSVLSSITGAAEAWGGYYLKTVSACALTLLLWVMLLGGSPAAAGIAGFLLPVLLFFTFQQIGALADSIGEHLSFAFTPGSSDDSDEEDED